MDISEKLNPVIRKLWKAPEPTEGKAPETAPPEDIVPLDTADPFWPEGEIPPKVKEAMIRSIEDGSAAHYSKSAGLPALRKAIAENIEERIGLALHPVKNILITPGSQSGLYFAMLPFIGVGDDVLVLDPCYPSNLDNPRVLGANVISVPLHAEDNFQPKVADLEKALTPQTKMLLINQPNNPTTAVIRREAVIELCDFVKKHDLILISDQAFEDHIYDGIELVTPATLPDMLERTLTIGSISKGHGLSGFRIGYIYGGEGMMAVLNQFITTVLGPATTVTSRGAIAALQSTDELAQTFEKLERRRKIAHEIFSSIPGVAMKMPESGILSWVNVSRLGTSEEIASYLKKEAKVSVTPGNHFGEYGEGYIRIVSGCFKEDEKAIEIFNRIKTALTQLGKEKGIEG
jgi:aspartate/methionine/tyrosine aminotransferase